MKGMEMMLGSLIKSLGLEPEALKAAITHILQVANSCDARLKRIEERLERIEALQRGEVPLSEPVAALIEHEDVSQNG